MTEQWWICYYKRGEYWVCLFCCKNICAPILGIYKSLTDIPYECENWDWGRAIPFLGIPKWDFPCSAAGLWKILKAYVTVFNPCILTCWHSLSGVPSTWRGVFHRGTDGTASSPPPASCSIRTATKIPFMYSFSGNSAATVSIPTFMCLWAIYIFPGSVHIFGCSKIGRLILEIKEAAEFHFWEYINGNQTFILDFHRPFICNATIKNRVHTLVL